MLRSSVLTASEHICILFRLQSEQGKKRRCAWICPRYSSTDRSVPWCSNGRWQVAYKCGYRMIFCYVKEWLQKDSPKTNPQCCSSNMNKVKFHGNHHTTLNVLSLKSQKGCRRAADIQCTQHDSIMHVSKPMLWQLTLACIMMSGITAYNTLPSKSTHSAK